MFIQFSRKCGQKHEIMDKHFESTYEHSSEPRKCVRVCSVDFYLKIKKKKKKVRSRTKVHICVKL